MESLRDLEAKVSTLSNSFKKEVTELLVFERKVKDRYQEILQQIGASRFLILYKTSNTDQIIKIVIRRDATDKNKAVDVLAEDLELESKIKSTPSFDALGDTILEINDIREKDKIISKLKYGF